MNISSSIVEITTINLNPAMPDFSLENELCASPCGVVVGVDEVGYGAIAGPVVSAAVYVRNRFSACISKVQDSKMLSPKKRAEIMEELVENVTYGIGFASVDEITQYNVLGASHLAMERALLNLNNNIDLVLIDGIHTPKISWPSKAIIQGDKISTSIAAASIIAKVTRDRFMAELHDQYPSYLWNKNCGYGTKEHLRSILQYGLTPYHRTTFAPVRRLLDKPDNNSRAARNLKKQQTIPFDTLC